MESRQLNQFITLKDSGEVKVKVDSNFLTNFNKELCRITKCSDVNQALVKIRRESKTRIKTKSNYLPEVFSVPKGIVKQWTRSMSLVSVPGLYSDLDLEKGKYEGGFKVWESTPDLIRFISEDNSVMEELLHRQSNKLKALELGAGASLPSLALLNRLIEDSRFKSEYRIHVQDYNWEVLASSSLLNFAVNLPLNYFQALIETKCLRFFYGDWKDFRSQSTYRYDLITMSEVLYNSDNYESLFNLLNKHLKRNGYIVIATKNTYFGLSGGLYSWLDFLDTKGVFRLNKLIHISANNIPRSILVLKRSS